MTKESKKSDRVKVEKKDKRSEKEKNGSKEQKQKAATSAFSLLADDKTVNPSLSSLFAVKQPAVKAKPAPEEPRRSSAKPQEDDDEEDDNDAELSEIDEEIDEDDEHVEDSVDTMEPAIAVEDVSVDDLEEVTIPKRKRKRKDGDDLEGAYMSRLAREGEKENARLAAERAAKRQKQETVEDATADNEEDSDAEVETTQASAGAVEEDDDEDAMSPPPKHETEQQADDALEKANRTVFLGNVSTDAITFKSSLKALKAHLASFFPSLKDSSDKYRLESIRFRSTPYASSIPKKAAYAKKELMDATTKSTNAYAVYSSPILAREAAKTLNGTSILSRHLRVDSVAHPSKIDHRRCIFVGNLGFVDDESNIQDANEEEGREVRKRGKEPADVEEGLWRTFSKCGKVESVRVIRDSTTRVGKGIAYVQFEDENAVEAALLLNEKKFPPMLPRKLRVSRAKAQKRNAKPGSGRPGVSKPSTNGYQRKLTSEEASKLGRTGKLLGRAAAANVRRTDNKTRPPRDRPARIGENGGIKKLESFVFEGHRASAKQGKSGLKLGGKHTKAKTGSAKVTKRSASFKAKKKAA